MISDNTGMRAVAPGAGFSKQRLDDMYIFLNRLCSGTEKRHTRFAGCSTAAEDALVQNRNR